MNARGGVQTVCLCACRVQPGAVPGVFKTPRTEGGSSASSAMKKKDKMAVKEVESRKRKRSALEEIREVTVFVFCVSWCFMSPPLPHFPTPSLDGGEKEGEIESEGQLDHGGVLVWLS